MPHRALRALLLVVPALVVAFAAACGGGDSNSGTSSGSGTTSSSKTTAPGTTAQADQGTAAAEIDQDNLTFKPSKVTIKAGEKVRFKNSESALHTVNVNGKNVSGNMKKDDSFLYTFAKAGTYKITCDYHPQMNASVVVQ